MRRSLSRKRKTLPSLSRIAPAGGIRRAAGSDRLAAGGDRGRFFRRHGGDCRKKGRNFLRLESDRRNRSRKSGDRGSEYGPLGGGKPPIYRDLADRAGWLLCSVGMIKLITGYSEYSADDLWHLGGTVAVNLPSLPIFSTLKPTPAEIDAEATALESALNMHGPGRKQAIATAFAGLAELLGEIAVNAPQVTDVTDMQLAEIGLPVVKPPQRSTQPPNAPQNLRLFHGASAGEVTGKCDSLGEKIRVYEAQWTLDPNGDTWSNAETFPNSRSFRFEGLTRGKDIWVRVRARNAIGAGAWSDPATIMVT
jgi:hypothetical protein